MSEPIMEIGEFKFYPSEIDKDHTRIVNGDGESKELISKRFVRALEPVVRQIFDNA